MRQEDKEVDGPEIEAAEERKRESELVEEKEDEVHDLDGLPETSMDQERTASVLAAMKTILAGEQIVVNDLKLPKRQLIALESLKAAVDGKDARLSRFVFAEDRRALLEQALAVLQPEIASLQGANEEFKALFDRVGELREKLNVLEDSEEELVEGRFHDQEKDAADTGDKDDDDLDDPKKKTGDKSSKKPKKKKKSDKSTDKPEDLSLDGPERPTEPKGPSTLTTGPTVKEEPKGPTTLEGGREVKIEPKETTLTGPARKEEQKGPSTLEGPARKVEPTGPTTLGDPKEIDAIAVASTPRWRRSGE